MVNAKALENTFSRSVTSRVRVYAQFTLSPKSFHADDVKISSRITAAPPPPLRRPPLLNDAVRTNGFNSVEWPLYGVLSILILLTAAQPSCSLRPPLPLPVSHRLPTPSSFLPPSLPPPNSEIYPRKLRGPPLNHPILALVRPLPRDSSSRAYSHLATFRPSSVRREIRDLSLAFFIDRARRGSRYRFHCVSSPPSAIPRSERRTCTE